jgi:hypothetical protein
MTGPQRGPTYWNRLQKHRRLYREGSPLRTPWVDLRISGPGPLLGPVASWVQEHGGRGSVSTLPDGTLVVGLRVLTALRFLTEFGPRGLKWGFDVIRLKGSSLSGGESP